METVNEDFQKIQPDRVNNKTLKCCEEKMKEFSLNQLCELYIRLA